MAFTATANRSNILPGGFASWKIKKMNAVADAAYYDLSKVKDGKISLKSYNDGDSKGQNIPVGSSLFKASCKVYNTDKTNVLKVLDAIMAAEVSHVITGVNGTVISPDGLTVKQFGTTCAFVCDADSDKNRYIEIGCQRAVLNTEITALLTTAAPAAGVANPADTFYPLLSLARSGIVPAGFSKVEIRLNPAGGYQDIGKIKNGKLRIEGVGDMDGDSMKMPIITAAKITASWRGFQASATEHAQLGALLSQVNDFKISLLDGTAITLNDQVGIGVEYVMDKDSDGNSYIDYTAEGIVPLSALDAIFV